MQFQIEKSLKNKQNTKFYNKVFHSNTSNLKDILSSSAYLEQIDFQNIQGTFKSWLKKYADFEALKTNFLSTDGALLLANISTFVDKWNSNDSEQAIMKVYNSFSYTEDIKYEARLLELPMCDEDFKFEILVPNEVDFLNNLFKKLTNEGLASATGCITPLFTSHCELNAPNIEFNSNFNNIQDSIQNFSLAATEFGNVKINAQGVSIKVLTCFTSRVKTESATVAKSEKTQSNPFYFALVFKDMPYWFLWINEDIIFTVSNLYFTFYNYRYKP